MRRYWTVQDESHLLFYFEEDGQLFNFTQHNVKQPQQNPGCLDAEELLRQRHASHPHRRWARARLGPGAHHFRIHRSPDVHSYEHCPDARQLYPRELSSSLATARILFSRLGDVLTYVEPTNQNRATYGHQLRHLLILACTEVESGLRSVLTANGLHQDHYSTRDYVRLRDPMRLPEWKVGLSLAPDFDELAPFHGWNESTPTQSLPWYDAYNAVKHNREQDFHRATLEALIDATAAMYIVTSAQFGAHHFVDPLHALPCPFRAVETPRWEPGEYYVPPRVPGGHESWVPTPLFP